MQRDTRSQWLVSLQLSFLQRRAEGPAQELLVYTSWKDSGAFVCVFLLIPKSALPGALLHFHSRASVSAFVASTAGLGPRQKRILFIYSSVIWARQACSTGLRHRKVLCIQRSAPHSLQWGPGPQQGCSRDRAFGQCRQCCRLGLIFTSSGPGWKEE